MKKETVALMQVGHSPTLKTVQMVEKTLQDAGEPLTIAQLKKKLPRQVMHSTLLQVLDYIQESGKILITTKGIVWTYMPREQLEALMKRGREF